MRVTTTAILAALLPFAAAQEDFFGQYKAQFQTIFDKIAGSIPNPGKHDPVAAAEAKAGSLRLDTLTLDNWRDTLYTPLKGNEKTPEDFWVLITGRNKTCFGRCGKIEQAFNETAAKFALLPKTPSMGLLNCEDQPILCNAWSANPGNLWVFEMLPQPAAIDIYVKKLNSTTTTSDDLVAFRKKEDRQGFTLLDSWFHPFDGKITELGLSLPFAYVVWGFNLIPQWAFMLVVSMLSRTFMGNRMGQAQQQRAAGAAGTAGAAPAGARPAAR